ncbi:MAG: hypothetical protein IJY12_02550 [Clostridia bacterium]|nr:hypothetical protein [Clostridia bacterium]
MERIEKRFRRDGMTFCTFVSERMETGIARADELYRRFCESAQKYAEDVVAKDAMLRYDADENPRKRFRFSASSCTCRILVHWEEDTVSVEGECVAMGKIVRHFCHSWDVRTERILLPPRPRRKRTRRRREAKAKSE